jgi:hypothetical protein
MSVWGGIAYMAISVKFSLSCAVLVVSLLLSFAFSTAHGTDETNVVFSEGFDGSTLDTSRWMVQENTNLSRYPAWGGAIAVNDSCVWLSSEGSVFPWINTVADPFPASGDFAVTWKLTYTTIADWGDGLVIYCSPHNDSSNPYSDRVLTLWAGDHGPEATSIYIELFGHGVWSLEVPGFRPTSEAHVYRLECRQGVYTVYVDGSPVASEGSQIRPDGIGIGHPPVYTLPNSPESTQMWAYWGWTSSKTDYIRVETLGGNDGRPRSTEIMMSISTATQELGYIVEVSGALISGGEPVSDAKVTLRYAITGETSWNALTTVTTDLNGDFSASWLPIATGMFTLRAEFAGNDEYSDAEVAKNISVLRTAGNGFYFAESNSTLTSITFNSTSNEISFTVSGLSGTTGYVKFAVPKELVSNIWGLRVLLDGRQLEHSAVLDGDVWLLMFEYSHSSHDVVISIPQSSSGDSAFPLASAAIIVLAFAAPLGFVALFRNRKKQDK